MQAIHFEVLGWAVEASPLILGLSFVLILLVVGTVAAMALPALQPDKWSDLGPRMASWWVICLIVAGALLLGWPALTALFALISFLALKEFLTLAPTRKEDRLVVLLAYLSILLNYGMVVINNYQVYLVIVPVYLFVATAAAMAWIGRTDGYLSTVGIVHWGVVV